VTNRIIHTVDTEATHKSTTIASGIATTTITKTITAMEIAMDTHTAMVMVMVMVMVINTRRPQMGSGVSQLIL